jgi:hypothetical protein
VASRSDGPVDDDETFSELETFQHLGHEDRAMDRVRRGFLAGVGA